MADPLLGRTIAHYEILSRLGGGGMGVVYKARDRKLDRHVALKFLPQQWSHDESAKQRFVREAQAASATHHPNICTVHDIATADDGQLFIVMGYYEGPTLKQRLEAGPLPVDEALDVATQVADGLAKAHAQGIVHRDIKPGNLILTEDGVRIVDFGLATFVDALQLTAQGSTLGTAAYMSPEQVRGEEADARTDVWAVGVVLYEMLTGHVPFRGTHAEAISYAIRTDSPSSIRQARGDVPEEIEQLVFRALHKDAAIRFASGRELARALRQVRGFTLPQDLRTVAVDARVAQETRDVAPRRRWRRAYLVAAAVVPALVVGASLWLMWPVQRVRVAVIPLANQTGDKTLDAYRMALTHEIIAQLADEAGIRVLPYERLQEIVQRFRGAGADLSSRDAIQAVAMHGASDALLLPTLVYDLVNREWKAHVEIRKPDTGESTTVETEPMESSLARETAYRLSVALAGRIRQHFLQTGPRRVRIAERLRTVMGRGDASAASRLRTLDAAAAFERGLHWYEQMEYAAARDAFAAAAEADPRDPLSLAWRSRLAILMRQDRPAVDVAERAVDLMRDDVRPDERLFIEAVVEEARRNGESAETRYRQLVARHQDAPGPVMDLAGFLDRQGRTDDAIRTYQQALIVDAQLPRAHVELCRLYSPARRDEPVLAKKHGEAALAMYVELGHRAGEAQALWCLADVLRNGNDAERREASGRADAALTIMETLAYPYGLARAHNYVALVALSGRDGARAATYFEKTLTGAKAVGNVLLESRTLMNLGVAYEMAGRRTTALKYYRDGFDVFESTGSQQDAAWTQVNAAGILIQYGSDPEQGLRDAQNALGVFQKIGDKQFEVFARQVIALYHRNVGDFDQALRELSVAENIARERKLDIDLTQVVIDEARVRFGMGDYDAVRELLLQVEASASGTDAVHVDIERGRANTRMGVFSEAAADLDEAADAIRRLGDVGSLPLLYAAQGELAYETGRLADARSFFSRASALWTDELPESASVEARAYLGLIDNLQRASESGLAAVRASLDQALKMRRVSLEARCRVFLARIAMGRGRLDDVVRVLDEMPEERQAGLSPDLRAQIHYWRSRALTRSGDTAGGEREGMVARRLIEDMRALLAEPYRTTVLSRPDLRFTW